MRGFCYHFSNLPQGWIYDMDYTVNVTVKMVDNVRAGMELLDGLSLNDPSPWTFVPPTPYVEDIVPIMKQAAEDVLDGNMKASLDSKRWSEREELHQKIVNNTINAFVNYTTYVFNALAFLRDQRDDRQCRLFSEGNVVDVGYQNLYFFVLYANESSNQTADEAWNELKNRTEARDAVLEQVFVKGSEDLCGRLTAAFNDHDVNKTAFDGIAAVKCGYEFVWYELGYTYFYAAYSSTDYKWQKKGGAYDAECGQIFFYP